MMPTGLMLLELSVWPGASQQERGSDNQYTILHGPPQHFLSGDERRRSLLEGRGTSFNHLTEKVLVVKDSFLTRRGKEMAEERHQYLEGFMKQFLREWNA